MNIQPLITESEFKKLCTPLSRNNFFIFKHSSVCSVSTSARDEVLKYLEKAKTLPVYELEVRKQRPLSNLISDQLEIPHESPQLILIKDGDNPIWNSSHFFISEESIENAILEHKCLVS